MCRALRRNVTVWMRVCVCAALRRCCSLKSLYDCCYVCVYACMNAYTTDCRRNSVLEQLQAEARGSYYDVCVYVYRRKQ